MNKLLCFLVFFSSYLIASDSIPEKGIATDVENSKRKVDIFSSRDDKIWKFKLKLSDVITTSPSGVLGPSESKVLSRKLSNFTNEIPNWLVEASEEENRLMSLGVLIGQNKKIQREIIKSSSTSAEQLKRSKSIVKEVNKLELIVKKLIVKTKKHGENLKKFNIEIERWNKYLIKTIQNDVGANLFTWKINEFILSPFKEFTFLWNGIQYDFDRSFNHVDQNVISKHISKIIFMSIMLIVAMGIILYLVDYTFSRFGQGLEFFHPTFADILRKIFSDRLLLVILFYLFSWIKLVTSIIPDVPNIFNVATLAPILSYVWIRFGSQVFSNLDPDSDRKLFNFGMILFIFLKMTILNIGTDSDALFFLSSILVMYLSSNSLRSLYRFTTTLSNEQKDSMSILFRSALFLTYLLCGLLFAAGLLEIIGFGIFSRLIQGVVFNNLFSFVFVWGAYHLVTSVLFHYAQKEIRFFNNTNNYNEFISFIQSGFNSLTIVVVALFVIRSWSENVFIFDSVWDLKLFSIGDYRLTLWRPISILFSFYLIKGAYLLTSYSIDSFWVYQLNISKKYSPSIKTLVRYSYIILFLGLCFGLLGFTYKNIVIFASALGVGIGFGLQNIVNNFISGIILLFERPIRVGDMIEVNNLFCRVCQIGIRSTIVETIDNSSIIIPNSEIISNRLTNWTLNSNIFAINCNVGVAYGTDTELVKKTLFSILERHPKILKNPASQVWFEEFGDSSLNFRFKFSIDEPGEKYQIRSEVMHEVNKAFSLDGIKIPFPQRDLHLKSSDVKLT
jgi:small-conductance mechanosensitive channel